MIDTVSVNTAEFTDEHWQQYFALRQALHQKYGAPLKLNSWQTLKEQALSGYENFPAYYHAVLNSDGDLVGWIDFFVRNVDTPEVMAFPRMEALYDTIPDEVSGALATWLLPLLDKHGLDKLYCNAWRDAWSDVVRSWGGHQFARCDEFALTLSQARRDLIAEWQGYGAKNNPDLDLSFHDHIPEPMLDDYIALMQIGLQDMPEEEESDIPHEFDRAELEGYHKWLRSNNMVQYHAFLTNEDDRLVGLSDLSVDRNSPGTADQFMTVVAPAYRGRGLAKWMKAAMFEHIEREVVGLERMRTRMRTVNEPIQHLNVQMGFRIGRQGREFRVQREGLLKAANSG